jgi:hypothetical protein
LILLFFNDRITVENMFFSKVGFLGVCGQRGMEFLERDWMAQ